MIGLLQIFTHHRVPNLAYVDAYESTSTLNLDSGAASSGPTDQQ